MSTVNQAKRRLIPRWRRFDETIRTPELSSDPSGTPKLDKAEADPFLEAKLREWEHEQSIGLVVDILSSAVVLGRTKELERFGWWILTKDEPLSQGVRDLASLVAHGPNHTFPKVQQSILEARAFLRRCRSMLADNPHDAILRVDTALALSMMGNVEKAETFMAAAVQLAPDNRFVLRSASRFWIHRHDPQRAREILLRSDRTGVDPWLLSSEVAISRMAGKSPRFIGKSRVLLHERRTAPIQLSELAGAVGTLEALDGSRKNARNFFNQSLIDPTENAVAQAVWAANEKVLPDFTADKFAYLRPDEAEAWQARAEQNWKKVIKACRRWSEQEPFSVQPFLMGSFTASMIDDYEESKLFCSSGLIANPMDFNLNNNLAVALFFEGDVEGALDMMNALAELVRNTQESAVSIATTGLALMYSGDLEGGRAAYRGAIDYANESGNRHTALFASAYWAKAEVALEGEPGPAIDTFQQLARGVQSPEIKYFRDRFSAHVKQSTA